MMFCVNPILHTQTKTASSVWFPLQIGNEWTYTDGFQTFTEKIVDTTRINGKLFYGLSGDSSYISIWYRSSNESLYIAIHPSKDTIETLLYNFTGKIGDSITTPFSIFACNFGNPIILVGKNDTIITPSGIYTGCYHFKHYPKHCTDSGLWDSWIAKGVGIVKSIVDNISGAQTYTLVSLKLTTIEQNPSENFTPENYLFNNYPNPFNPTTTITFDLSVEMNTVVQIYDIFGKTVTTLFDGRLLPGKHSFKWNGADRNGVSVSSGVYFYRLEVNGFSKTRKMLLLR